MEIIRKTKSVKLILNQFEKRDSAISTVDLIEKLNSEINKTTVYRILDKLEYSGVLHSFLGLNGIRWYAKCKNCSTSHHSDLHPHFQCTSCGKVDCLDIKITMPTIPNREVTSSQFLLQGKCERCSS